MSETFDLQPALSGERIEIDGPGGTLSYYCDTPDSPSPAQAGPQRPLLLVHSVNAAASAYEIKPLYDHYRAQRMVIAVDLPGYGFSARPKLRYEPPLMTASLAALLDRIVGEHGPVDIVGLSLSCEFVARLAIEHPESIRTVALISPTGFSGKKSQDGERGSTRGMPWLYKAVTGSDSVGRKLFAALTSRPSVRYFLRKTWGRKEIDEGAFEYAWATAHQPGARHAPFSFLSGYLFGADIDRIYQQLSHPVWMAHGNRGDFTDYRRKSAYADKANWEIASYDTGALPHFEIIDRLSADYDAFLNRNH